MRIFLSYSGRDSALAEALARALRRQAGPDVEIFYASRELRGGVLWQESLAEKVAKADAFVLLIAESGVGPWQVPEYCEAYDRWVQDRSPVLVPVLKEGQSAPGLPFLKQLHWIIEPDPASERSAGRILDAIRSPSFERLREPWRHARPYRGLLAMTEADTDFFFGREAETESVLRTFESAPGRLPILLGNSGAGKTSIAQAGVLAALKRQAWPRSEGAPSWPGPFRESRRWAMLGIRPGKLPLRSLVDAFWPLWRHDALDPDREALQAKWVQRIQGGAASLRGLLDATQERLSQIGEDPPQTFLLYVDQGEELYTRADPGQAMRFSEMLAAGLEDERFRAFMSLRSDFYGRLQEDGPLYRLWERIDIHPLDREALLDVVDKPVESLGAAFLDPALPGELVRQTHEQAGLLPLLSYLLDDMWSEMQKRGDGRMVPGAGTVNVGSVLAASGDRFLHENPASTQALRRLITLKLVHLEEHGRPLRRRAFRSEFTDEQWQLVTVLAGSPWRLLVTGRIEGEGTEPFAEVGHEALLREWSQLKDWLTGERGQREFLTWKTALERMRLRYDRLSGEEKRRALLQGYDLQQARAWISAHEADLPAADRSYIEASIEAEDQEIETGRQLLAQARRAQSSFLGDLARQHLAEGRIDKALALAAEAVPANTPDWPAVPVAENALFAAVHAHSAALFRPITTFAGHEGTVRGAAFSGDGSRVLTWSYDGTARIWDPGGLPLAVLRHEDYVLGAAFSGGGERVLTWSRDGAARIWSTAGGGPPLVLRHERTVKGARFSSDERRVLTWSHDGTARIWDAELGGLTAVLQHEGRVAGAVFSADQTLVLTWSWDGTARLWQAASGSPQAVFTHGGPVRGARFSSDEASILTWSTDGAARLWTRRGEPLAVLRHGERDPENLEKDYAILGAVFANNESRILTWAADGTARTWSSGSAEQLQVFPHQRTVAGALLSGDETRLLTWAVDGSARLWDTETARELGREDHGAGILGGAFSPNGNPVLTWSNDGVARLWSESSKSGNRLALRHDGPVRKATFSTTGQSVWTLSDDGTVRLWSTLLGTELAVSHHEGEAFGWVTSPEEGRILTWSADGTARLLDYSGQGRYREIRHGGPVRGAALTRDGRRALTWSADGTARLGDLAAGGQEIRLQHEEALLGAAFSPSESQVLTWAEDRKARLWDAGSGERLAEMRGAGDGSLLGARWLTEGCLALWDTDGKVKLWEADGAEKATLDHQRPLAGLASTSDGRQVLTWSEDGLVRLWDTAGGRQVFERQHEALLTGACLSRSGDRILTRSTTGKVHLQSVAEGGGQLEVQHAGSVMGAIFSPDETQVLSWSLGTARLWESSTGEQRALFPHRNAMTGAAFSAAGTQLLTWAHDGMARVWDARTGQVLVTLLHELGVSQASFSSDEKWVLTNANGVARLWDRETGDALATLGETSAGGALLAADNRGVLAWSPRSDTACVWPIWSSRSALTERASAVLATLRPLSRIDRRRAHLDPDSPRELTGASERDLAILGDTQFSSRWLRGVGNLTDFAVGTAPDLPLQIEVAIQLDGRVFLLHNLPFEGLDGLEFHRLTRSLHFIRKDGESRTIGLPVTRPVADGLEGADRALLVHLRTEDREILGASYLPLDGY